MPVGRVGGVNSGALHHPYPRAFCNLPSFARIKGPGWRPVELNDRHLRSYGKIGDCELSKIEAIGFLCLLFAYANADTMQSCRNFDHYFI